MKIRVLICRWCMEPFCLYRYLLIQLMWPISLLFYLHLKHFPCVSFHVRVILLLFHISPRLDELKVCTSHICLLFFFLLALLLEARCHSFSLKYIKGSEKWHNHRERRCGDDTNSIMFRYSETGGWKERKAEIRTMPTSNFEVPYTNQLKNDIFLSKISSLTIYSQFP